MKTKSGKTTTHNDDYATIFDRLKTILIPYAKHLNLVHDTELYYYLDTKHVLENGKPLFFGAVRKGKAYVSFYLMPVYSFPELKKGLSPALRKRMQGKSCFNFKSPDESLFVELEKLTRAGHRKYKTEKYA